MIRRGFATSTSTGSIPSQQRDAAMTSIRSREYGPRLPKEIITTDSDVLIAPVPFTASGETSFQRPFRQARIAEDVPAPKLLQVVDIWRVKGRFAYSRVTRYFTFYKLRLHLFVCAPLGRRWNGRHSRGFNDGAESRILLGFPIGVLIPFSKGIVRCRRILAGPPPC